jgi:hypothetical protein
MKRLTALFALGIALLAPPAEAFPYVVQKGDTLASIAERFYGRIQHERLLVTANALDAQGGIGITPGMLLEIPAVGHVEIKQGDTWAALARTLLGAAERADVLSMANHSSPWLTPDVGAEIIVPYNLRVVVSSSDTLVGVAYRYLGDKNKAWTVDRYNRLSQGKISQGEVLLIPLTDLALTQAGRTEARAAATRLEGEASGDKLLAQRGVQSEIPALVADVRSGRFVDAVTRGTRFLSSTALTRTELATIHRQLLEAYVALGATGLAATSCAEWRKANAQARLDPVWMSPKLIRACQRSMGR